MHVELQGELLGHSVFEQDGELALAGGSQQQAALPFDEFHVAAQPLQPPWEVAGIVAAEVVNKENFFPGDEIVVGPDIRTWRDWPFRGSRRVRWR